MVIAHFPGQLETFVVEALGDPHVRLPVGESAGGFERSQSFLWKLATAGHGEDVVHATAAFVQVTTHLPEAPERGAEAHRVLGVA